MLFVKHLKFVLYLLNLIQVQFVVVLTLAHQHQSDESAQIKDAAAELGTALLPVVRDAVVEFNNFIQTVDFSQIGVQLTAATKDLVDFFNVLNNFAQEAQSGTLFGGEPLIERIIDGLRATPEKLEIVGNDIQILFLNIQKGIEEGIQSILSSDVIQSFGDFIASLFPEEIAGQVRSRFNELDNIFDTENIVNEINELTEANTQLRVEIQKIRDETDTPLRGIFDNLVGDITPVDINNFIIPFRNAIAEIEKLSELLTIEGIDTQDLLIDLQALGIQADNFAEAMAGVNKELEELTLIEIDLEDTKNDVAEINTLFAEINDAILKAANEQLFLNQALSTFHEITNTIADAFVDAFNIANTAFGNLVSSILKQATALAARLGALSLVSLIPGVGSFASLIRLAFAEGGIVPNIKVSPFSEGGIVPNKKIPGFEKGGIINNVIEGFQAGGIKTTDTVPSMLTPGEAVIPASSVQNNRSVVDSLIASPEPLQSTFSPVQQSSPNINIAFNGFDELSAVRILQSPEFQNTFADIINNGDLKVEVEGKQIEVIR